MRATLDMDQMDVHYFQAAVLLLSQRVKSFSHLVLPDQAELAKSTATAQQQHSNSTAQSVSIHT